MVPTRDTSAEVLRALRKQPDTRAAAEKIERLVENGWAFNVLAPIENVTVNRLRTGVWQVGLSRDGHAVTQQDRDLAHAMLHAAILAEQFDSKQKEDNA